MSRARVRHDWHSSLLLGSHSIGSIKTKLAVQFAARIKSDFIDLGRTLSKTEVEFKLVAMPEYKLEQA